MPGTHNSDVFVLDNGGYTLKAGFSNQPSCKVLPNSITKAKSEKRRAFIADQIDDCRDLSSLFYLLPFQKGYLVNWDHQKNIWDYVFGKNCFNLETSGLRLIFTEPHFNFNTIKEGLNELFFEEFQFKSVLRTHSTDLSCYRNKLDQPAEEAALVVDTGYSFSHIVPYVAGRAIHSATTRVDIGGKLLTNHLKEIISYRQIHVLEETYVMNASKEDACFVSLDFDKDLSLAWEDSKVKIKKPSSAPERDVRPLFKIARDYVLPDFTTLRRGFLKSAELTGRPDEGEQTIRLNNERFTVPELLFNPSDIGIQQCGLAEAVVDAISKCSLDARPWLYRNIVLTGGSANFRNFRKRMEKEIRHLAPDKYDVVVRQPEDPTTYAWSGGAALAKDSAFNSMCVTREEYLEQGHSVCHERYFL